MSGGLKSLGGFLGLTSGPTVDTQTQNQGLDQLNANNNAAAGMQGAEQAYMNGSMTSDQALAQAMHPQAYNGPLSQANVTTGHGNDSGGNGGLQTTVMNQNGGSLTPGEQQAAADAFMTSGNSGSKYATEQVQNNAITGQLFGKGGQLSNEIGQYGQQSDRLNNLQNQGFNLTPGDNTMYGQMSGNIANQYGQQGNQLANQLASRGMSDSGAAGAQFSGLMGNQNQALAQAQQGIAQQRYQNTLQQIGQQQNFMGQLQNNIGSLGQQGANDIQEQYGRQLAGAQNDAAGTARAAGLSIQNNDSTNKANLGQSNFAVANTPANFSDYLNAGTGSTLQSVGSAPGKVVSSGAGTMGQAAGAAAMA